MSTLVLTTRAPTDPTSGYDLRVLALADGLSDPVHLHIVSLDRSNAKVDPTVLGRFSEVSISPPPPDTRASLRRHLRFDDNEYLRRAYPEWFSSVVEVVRARCAGAAVSRMIVFGPALAGLARDIGVSRTLLDVCDSPALTLSRELGACARLSAYRMRRSLSLLRLRRSESVLPDLFSAVTTISPADTAEIVRLHRDAPSNVYTVPNGVDERYLAPLGDPSSLPGVAFWGNLAFPPNREALRCFVRSVYLPHLKEEGVRMRIVGGGADRWLLDLARDDPNLELVGYVPDLAAAVRAFPLMVNPMLIGSGLKNKVLEAFALGLVVVSTELGVEAISEAVPGQHYVRAESPACFAAAVLELLRDEPRRAFVRAHARHLVERTYRWHSIAASFDRLVPT